MKIHKYAAGLFLLVGVLHLVLVLKVMDTRDILVTVSGILALLAAMLLTVLCHVIKNRKVEIRFHRILSCIIAILLVVHMVSYAIDFNDYKTAISRITIDEIDLSEIDDGEYIGECDAGYIYAKVKVVVEDHSIKRISILEHNHERGAASESIIETMVKKQKVDVDAVTGATNSSLVIKRACANALLQ